MQHFAVAQSLSTNHDDRVTIQVMNTGQLPCELYKGTKLATFTPREHIFVLENGHQENVHRELIPHSNANKTHCHLLNVTH